MEKRTAISRLSICILELVELEQIRILEEEIGESENRVVVGIKRQELLAGIDIVAMELSVWNSSIDKPSCMNEINYTGIVDHQRRGDSRDQTS